MSSVKSAGGGGWNKENSGSKLASSGFEEFSASGPFRRRETLESVVFKNWPQRNVGGGRVFPSFRWLIVRHSQRTNGLDCVMEHLRSDRIHASLAPCLVSFHATPPK